MNLVSVCGGKGTCGGCKVQILDGDTSPPTSTELDILSKEDLEAGYRLACQTFPSSNLKVHVPPESLSAPQRLQVEGLEVTVSPEPIVQTYQLQLSPPSWSDLSADAQRLQKALEEQHQVCCHAIDNGVLRELSHQLRSCDWQIQASVRSTEVIAISPRHTRQVGLAVDLGTTKIAGYLVDLTNGQTLASQGIMNPQISYGEDIITRMSHVISSPAKRTEIQELTARALNQLAADLCDEVGAQPEEILEMVVVGNTAMHHFLLGLPIEQLASPPFIPAVSGTVEVKSRDLGINIASGAWIHLPPNIAGFVGADHVAGLLATELWQAEGVVMAVDIGTNTEISLVSDGEITCVSCASGPAFEGAHIKDGMRASPGAIEHVQLVNNQVKYQTIDGIPPVGLCGSGILDTIAQLYLTGVLDVHGRIAEHPRVRTVKGQREFLLLTRTERDGLPAITITQHDVREIQLAKGAIRAGIQMLLQDRGLSEEQVQQIIIAGAFGSYIDIASAVAIGMLPPLPLNRFRQVGNAAGTGARIALLSRSKRAEAETIAQRVRYIELSTAPDFQDIFVRAMYLGHQTT